MTEPDSPPAGILFQCQNKPGTRMLFGKSRLYRAPKSVADPAAKDAGGKRSRRGRRRSRQNDLSITLDRLDPLLTD
jgi:hypothetical protein